MKPLRKRKKDNGKAHALDDYVPLSSQWHVGSVVSSGQVAKRAALRRCNNNSSTSAPLDPNYVAYVNAAVNSRPAVQLPVMFVQRGVAPLYTLFALFYCSALSPLYRDSVGCDRICTQCGALFWHAERIKSSFKDKKIHYHRCCENGHVSLSHYEDPPVLLKQLLETAAF